MSGHAVTTGKFANPVESGSHPLRVPQPYGAAIPAAFAAELRVEAERRIAARKGQPGQ